MAIVISQNPVNKPEFRDLEGQIAERASKAGLTTYITPHLYNVKSDGPVMTHLRRFDGILIVVSWMYPRATRWLLHRCGLAANERALHVLDAKEISDAEAFMTKILEIAEATDWIPELEEGESPEPVILDEQVKLRWYPVVDFRKCIGCMECIDFCLFGVYGLDEDNRLFVEQPDSCRPGCPACARVCPTGAIMFPQNQTPEIAGATPDEDSADEATEGQAEEIARQERKTYLEEAGRAEDVPEDKPKGDELDSLMDELEKDWE